MRIDKETFDRLDSTRPRLMPWLALLFVGSAALGVYFLVSPATGSGAYYRSVLNRMTYGYNRQVLLLFVPYGLALWSWWRGSRVSWKLLLGGAVFLHLLVLFAPLPQSQDFYQYLFYGRMQAAYRANPYVIQPLRYWTDPWYIIRWPYQTSVYGPAWTLLSFGVAKAAGSSLTLAVVLMKLAILAMDLSVMASILALSRDRPDPERAAGWGLLLYAWNPLILITVPLGGLADVGIAAAILGAVVARRRGRTWVATILLTLATLVKIYGGIALILHLVLLAKERGRRGLQRHGLLAAGMVAAASAPYWAGWQTFRGLIRIADLSNKSLTGTIQKLLMSVLRFIGVGAARNDAAAIIRWGVFAGLFAAVVWAVRRVKTERDVWHGTAVVLSIYVLLTPWYLYWYLVTPLALFAILPRSRFTVPLVVFTGTTLITTPFRPWLLGQVVQTVIRYGPPIAVYAWLRSRDGEASITMRRKAFTAPPVARADPGRFVTLV